MAWTSGKAAADIADLSSLLGLTTGKNTSQRGGCWPGEGDRSGIRSGKERRGCWPDASDLPSDDISPAEALRKILRGRQL